MKAQLASSLSLVLLASLTHAQAPQYPACANPSPSAELKHAPSGADSQAKLPLRDYFQELSVCVAPNGEAVAFQSPQSRPSASEPKPVASLWLEADRRAHTDLLATKPVEVLVAPLQVQGYGFDVAERSLMSADLAYALGDNAADPFLVARALGEGRRRISMIELQQLAQRLKAKTLVVGYVGHADRKNMFLTLQQWTAAGEPGGWKLSQQKDWRSIPFSHEDMPSTVFHRMLPEVITQLQIKTTAKARQLDKTPVFPTTVAYTPQEIATGEAKGWPASSALLLLAGLAPNDAERTRERMFERALLASMNLDASSARQRFTQAFALMQLGRRPAALRLLKDDQHPAANVLRELINGNLPTAAAGAVALKQPFEQLLLTLALQDLAADYKREQPREIKQAVKMFTTALDAWGPLVALRLTAPDRWQVPPAEQVKAMFDEVLPQPGLDMKSIAGGVAVVNDEYSAKDIDVVSARHLRRSIEQIDLRRQAGPAPALTDLIWLLEATAEARLVKTLDMISVVQGNYRDAATWLDEYRPFFEGHPALAPREAWVAQYLKQAGADEEAPSWHRKAEAAILLALEYAQEQSPDARGALDVPGRLPGAALFKEGFAYDYPRRSYWPMPSASRTQPFALDPALSAEALAFSQGDTDPAFQLMVTLTEPEKGNMLSSIEQRFKGSPNKPVAPVAAKQAGPEEHFRAAIQADPTVWRNYDNLALTLIQYHGDYAEAAKVYRSYPGFDLKATGKAVERSNNSYDAGSTLYWAGQFEMAKPLYEFSAQLETGSYASMSSAIRLNLLVGNYREAAAGSLSLANRYPTAYAFRDYLSMLSAMGHGEDAWLGFSQVATKFDLPQVWVAALVGHRKEGLDQDGLRKWLMQPQIREARFRSRKFAPAYALMWSSTDTVPPADLGKLIDTLEGTTAARVGPDTPVRSALSMFSDGYVLLRAGKHAEALEKFRAYLERYPVVGEGAEPYVLPYIAAASAATGDPLRLERTLPDVKYPEFDVSLAKAFFHAYRKEVDAAETYLRRAFWVRPHTDYRPILTEYQFAEACELVFQVTGDVRFKDMLLDWSRRHQRIQPTHAWAYAMQYTYEQDPAARQRALAMTLYLDPKSSRIAKARSEDLSKARQWLEKNNPFTRSSERQVQAGVAGGQDMVAPARASL